jgi:hypothetical protein
MSTAVTVLIWIACAWMALGVAAGIYALRIIWRTRKMLEKPDA